MSRVWTALVLTRMDSTSECEVWCMSQLWVLSIAGVHTIFTCCGCLECLYHRPYLHHAGMHMCRDGFDRLGVDKDGFSR